MVAGGGRVAGGGLPEKGGERERVLHCVCYTCIGEKKGKAKDEYYGKLILNLGNEVRSSVEQGTTAMEKLVEKLGNAEDKAECKKLKKQDFEERQNEAIDVPIEDEKSPSSEPRGSPHDA
ncbi:hypothetical protein Tco_0676962 [Tanacetum coccineum]